MFSCALACRRVFDAEIMQFSLHTISCFFLFVLIHHLCSFSKFVILNRDLFRPVDILILDATTPTIVGPKNVKSCWIVLAEVCKRMEQPPNNVGTRSALFIP